ncbi:MAG: 4-hydroxy-tetrahydrodipicolinate synthase [Ruminococcaceae bacterium]|nr:4-hydroxy-tetrahydrodipicolinate synthase [Oscillospiraceae bacterium]
MSLHKSAVFYGVATALITPFREDSIDYNALADLIEQQIEGGIDALLVAGTTGEGATLSYREHHDVIAFAKERIGGRVPLLAGCGSNSTARAIELAQNACEAGADALLAVTPYYNKASHRGLILHYEAIANAATRPLMLYNVPSRTGVSLGMEEYRALAKHPNIVGVKESSGDLGLMEALIAECGEELDVYAGNDDQLIPALKLGAVGGISVYSNLFPEQMSRLYRLFVNGSRQLADQTQRALIPYYKSLFWEVNPIPVKYAASLMGLCQAEYRLPLCPPSKDNCRRLKALFATNFEKNS